MRVGVIGAALVAGVVASAHAGAQSPPIVDVTNEPSHHVEMSNEWVRVLDVRVAPHTTTMIHRHVDDYLFVTLDGGAAEITNTRLGQPPVQMALHAGDVNFAAGLFAHSATVNSDATFHNTTIALLHPATHVARCDSGCVWRSDQWVVNRATIPPGGRLQIGATADRPALVVGVSSVWLTQPGASADANVMRGGPGSFAWLNGLPGGGETTVQNAGDKPAQVVTLEFKGLP